MNAAPLAHVERQAWLASSRATIASELERAERAAAHAAGDARHRAERATRELEEAAAARLDEADAACATEFRELLDSLVRGWATDPVRSKIAPIISLVQRVAERAHAELGVVDFVQACSRCFSWSMAVSIVRGEGPSASRATHLELSLTAEDTHLRAPVINASSGAIAAALAGQIPRVEDYLFALESGLLANASSGPAPSEYQRERFAAFRSRVVHWRDRVAEIDAAEAAIRLEEIQAEERRNPHFGAFTRNEVRMAEQAGLSVQDYLRGGAKAKAKPPARVDEEDDDTPKVRPRSGVEPFDSGDGEPLPD